MLFKFSEFNVVAVWNAGPGFKEKEGDDAGKESDLNGIQMVHGLHFDKLLELWVEKVTYWKQID